MITAVSDWLTPAIQIAGLLALIAGFRHAVPDLWHSVHGRRVHPHLLAPPNDEDGPGPSNEGSVR